MSGVQGSFNNMSYIHVPGRKKYQGFTKREALALIDELREMSSRVKEISNDVMKRYGYISKPGEMAEKLNLMRTTINGLCLALGEAIPSKV